MNIIENSESPKRDKWPMPLTSLAWDAMDRVNIDSAYVLCEGEVHSRFPEDQNHKCTPVHERLHDWFQERGAVRICEGESDPFCVSLSVLDSTEQMLWLLSALPSWNLLCCHHNRKEIKVSSNQRFGLGWVNLFTESWFTQEFPFFLLLFI